MNENQNERLFLALGEVGGDLVDLAECGTFRPNFWRRWGAMAACVALLLGLTAVSLPRLLGGPARTGTGEEQKLVADAERVTPRQRLEFRYTYYYLDDEVRPGTPEDLGEPLGVVEAAEDPWLVDAQIYRRLGTAEYTNHMVHGLSVYQQVYVNGEDGYRLATTFNEKVVARYSYEDVADALHREDTAWVLRDLIAPVVKYADDITFEEAAQLSSESLNRLFLASTELNTGVSVAELWAAEEGYVVPAADVHWRLNRLLREPTYWPEQTAAYDARRDALVFGAETFTAEMPWLRLDTALLSPEEALAELTVTVFADEAMTEPLGTKTYGIRFDGACWYYEWIREE